jgi:hypothetical protein
MTNKEKLRAHALRREGLSYAEIAETLSDESEDGRKFDRATIYRVCKNMPVSPLDAAFEWHKLEEHGIPWEASSFIMEMLGATYECTQWVIENRQGFREKAGIYLDDCTPTFEKSGGGGEYTKRRQRSARRWVTSLTFGTWVIPSLHVRWPMSCLLYLS